MDKTILKKFIENDKNIESILIFLLSSNALFSIIISFIFYVFMKINVFETFFFSVINIGLIYFLILLILLDYANDFRKKIYIFTSLLYLYLFFAQYIIPYIISLNFDLKCSISNYSCIFNLSFMINIIMIFLFIMSFGTFCELILNYKKNYEKKKK
jgi:hypothetical protein